MLTLKRVDHKYVVTYHDIAYIFTHSRSAWVFIFSIREECNK